MSYEPAAYELYHFITEFLKVHEEWENDGTDSAPGTVYFDKLRQVFECFKNNTCPKAFRPGVGPAIEILERLAIEHDQTDDIMPPAKFFNRGVEELKLQMQIFHDTLHKPFYVEPIQQLLKMENITDQQIARTYGLLDEQTGTPQTHLVQKERETPGSVIPANWKHPKEVARIARLNAWESGKQEFTAPETPTPKARPEAPESWDELFSLQQSGLSVEQMAKMKNVSVEVAQAELEKVSRRRQQLMDRHLQRQAEPAIDTNPDIMSTTMQVSGQADTVDPPGAEVGTMQVTKGPFKGPTAEEIADAVEPELDEVKGGEYADMSREQLLALCNERSIGGYPPNIGENVLIQLLQAHDQAEAAGTQEVG